MAVTFPFFRKSYIVLRCQVRTVQGLQVLVLRRVLTSGICILTSALSEFLPSPVRLGEFLPPNRPSFLRP